MHFEPSADSALRRYGLEQLLLIIGVSGASERTGAPTIYCGSEAARGARAAIWIPPDDANTYAPDRPPRFTTLDGVLVPHGGEPPKSIWQGNRLNFDVARATAFWLTLESEGHAPARDAHGRVPAKASLLAAAGCLNRPPVHAYADLLSERLGQWSKFDDRLPLWPNGKRFAVGLSHDVDAPERAGRLRPLVKELLFSNRRPRRHVYWDLRAALRSSGIANACFNAPSRRPEWDFAEFCALEHPVGLRSAFYFSTVDRRRGHPCDVSYSCDRRRYRRLFRQLQSGGWEIGLQAGNLTWEERPRIKPQLDGLSSLAKTSIRGLRHHYLRLNPQEPLRTLAAHAADGASYDSTVGFNDAPGFRAGVALPYQPYNPHTQAAGLLVELPMTIADMHLPNDDVTAAVQAVKEHLRLVKALGGMAVLNWHVGNWHAAPAWRESYRAACRILDEDPAAWPATPAELAWWWRQRTEALR